MNSDIIKGKWGQLKGQVKQRWGKLTDDDLKRIEGNFDQASGVLQERYGHTRELAEREWKTFCDENCRDDAVGGSAQRSQQGSTANNPGREADQGRSQQSASGNQNREANNQGNQGNQGQRAGNPQRDNPQSKPREQQGGA